MSVKTPIRVIDPAVQRNLNYLYDAINQMSGGDVSKTAQILGQINAGSTVPTWLTNDIALPGRITSYYGVPTMGLGTAPIRYRTTASGIIAAISITDMTNTNKAGFYRVSLYVLTVTGDRSTAVNFRIKWDNEAYSQNLVNFTVSPTGYTHGACTIHHTAAGGSCVRFDATTPGTGTTGSYSYWLTCEQLD
jgi:hypothetical protein